MDDAGRKKNVNLIGIDAQGSLTIHVREIRAERLVGRVTTSPSAPAITQTVWSSKRLRNRVRIEAILNAGVDAMMQLELSNSKLIE